MLDAFLAEWERWAAELLESQLSFPVLSYYRSQHDNQSWLVALTMMLDTSALLLAEVDTRRLYQAQLTFAIARHAAVDLCLVLKTAPRAIETDRLPDAERDRLRAMLQQADLSLRDDRGAKFRELREMYEPFVNALANRFLFTLPPIFLPNRVADNWQRSAWTVKTPGIGQLPPIASDSDHFV